MLVKRWSSGEWKGLRTPSSDVYHHASPLGTILVLSSGRKKRSMGTDVGILLKLANYHGKAKVGGHSVLQFLIVGKQ